MRDQLGPEIGARFVEFQLPRSLDRSNLDNRVTFLAELENLVVARLGRQTKGDGFARGNDIRVLIEQLPVGFALGIEERRDVNSGLLGFAEAVHTAPAVGQSLGEIVRLGGDFLERLHPLLAFLFGIFLGENEGSVAQSAHLRGLQGLLALIISFAQLLVGNLDFFGEGHGVELDEDNIGRRHAGERRFDIAGQHDGRRFDECFQFLQAKRITDNILQLALGEPARRELLLHKVGVFRRIELTVLLEDRHAADLVDDSLRARLDLQSRRFVLQDHEIPDEVRGGFVLALRLPRQIPDKVELPQGQGQLVIAHRLLHVDLHHIAAVDLGHHVGAHPVHLGGVVEKSESDDGKEGDNQHKPTLVFANRGEHRIGVLKKVGDWLKSSGS